MFSGLKPYPLSIQHIKDVRKDLLDQFLILIKSSDLYKDRDMAILSLNLQAIVREILTRYIAELLRSRGTREQIAFFSPAEDLYTGSEIRPTIYTRLLEKELRLDPFWKKPLRKLKSQLLSDDIPYQYLCDNKPHQTLTFSRAPLILKHRDEKNVALVRNDFSDWLTSRPPIHSNQGFHSQSVDLFLCTIQVIFTKHNVQFSENTKLALIKFLQTHHLWTNHYLNCVEIKKSRLPDNIWIGSAGNIFIASLAFIARKEGRCVTGHDHGTGSGWLNTLDQTLVEFNYVDQFYTFSSLMAQGLRQSLHRDYLFNLDFGDESIVYGKEEYPNSLYYVKKSAVQKLTKPTVIFIATTYMKNFIDSIPRMPADIALDWHERLFAQLREYGFDVIYRAHPEDGFVANNEGIFKAWNIMVDKTPNLIQACQKADFAILDFSCTTALVDLLKVNYPILLLDSGHEDIQPQAMVKLKSSVSYVRLTYDVQEKVIMPVNLYEMAYGMYNKVTDNQILEYFGE